MYQSGPSLTDVRLIIEYAAPTWLPYFVKHKRKQGKIQIYTTRLVSEPNGVSYVEGEIKPTLEAKIVTGDMFTTYNILR